MEYSVEQGIIDFFKKTSATRSECDALARELVGGDVAPVAVQGVCSYTVYAGEDAEYVVQFRLHSLELKEEITSLARQVFGKLAPEVSFQGQVGEGKDGKRPLLVYVMDRIRGISHLDFILSYSEPENSAEWFAWRSNLVTDVARFFALAWKSPQPANRTFIKTLSEAHEKDLRRLLSALPERFHRVIQECLNRLPEIFALPMVLLHNDFGPCNIMVDSTTCQLVGVIDWAEAEVGPFGSNLYCLQSITGKFHLKNGWIRYEDYDSLHNLFWETLRAETGLSKEQMETAKWASIAGLLLSWGFTSRLASMPAPVPIRDDESGAYELFRMDGLLIDPATKIV